MFSPYFEPFLELLAVDGDIVVDGEEHLRFCFWGYFEPPAHGVGRRTVEIDISFPLIFIGIHTHFFHGLFVVPHDIDLRDDGAIHGSVPFEVLHELGVVTAASVGDRDEAKPDLYWLYVVGTYSSLRAFAW